MPGLRRWTFVVALGALGCAACGSTVSLSSQQTGRSSGLDAPTGVADGGTGPSSAVGPGSGGGLGSTGTGSAAPGSGPTGGVTANNPGAGGATTPTAQGVTATTISIGVGYTTNADAANAALGAANVNEGDPRADAQAVIDDINAHGGVAHRKLVPVWNARNAQSTQPGATLEQQACANYTQDHHVFAAIDVGTVNLISCITRSALLLGGGVLAQYDEQDFARFPYFIDPGTLDVDSQGAAEVPLWVKQGYFSPWNATTGAAGTTPAKVGILSIDIPSWNHEVDHVLLPLLANYGIHVAAADIFRIYSPPSAAQDGTTVGDIQNATLKMRADGVDHVIDLDANGSLTLLFANDAYSQHYYPRLGVNSAAGLQALQGDIQPASLNGAMGLGWMPVVDLPSSADGDNSGYSSAGRRHCMAVMRAAGQSFTSTEAELIALTYCDDLYLIKRVVDSLTTITRATFMAAVDNLGSSWPAAEAPTLSLATGHHDGITRGWDMRYVSACQCVRYFGSPFDIP